MDNQRFLNYFYDEAIQQNPRRFEKFIIEYFHDVIGCKVVNENKDNVCEVCSSNCSNTMFLVKGCFIRDIYKRKKEISLRFIDTFKRIKVNIGLRYQKVSGNIELFYPIHACDYMNGSYGRNFCLIVGGDVPNNSMNFINKNAPFPVLWTTSLMFPRLMKTYFGTGVRESKSIASKSIA